MWRRLLIVVAVLAGVITGAALAVQSPRIGDNLRGRLERFARERWGLILQVETLRVSLLPPGLTIGGVTLQRVADARTHLALHEGEIEVRPWPSSSGALVVHRLRLDGLRGHIRLPPSSTTPALDSAMGYRLPIEVENLALWNGDLVIESDDWTLALQRLDVRQAPNAIEGWDVGVDLGAAQLRTKAVEIPFELHAVATLEGSLSQPRRLLVRRAQLNVPRNSATTSGFIDLREHGEQNLRTRIRADLPSLAAQIGSPVPLGGTAEATLTVQGSRTRPRVQVQLAAAQLSIASTLVGDVALDGLLHERRLALEALRIEHPRAGSVTGSGQIDLDKRPAVRLTTRLHDVSLPEVLELLGLSDAHVRLRLDGDLRVAGVLWPPALDTELDLEAKQFEVLDGSYRDPESWMAFGFPTARVAGSARIAPHEVQLGGMTVTRGTSRAVVSGTLTYDLARGMDLRASADRLDLADLGAIAGVSFGGVGNVGASIEGPYEHLTISGTAQLADFGLFGYRFGDATAAVVFQNMNLSCDNIIVRRNRGTATGSLTLAFTQEQPRIRGDFDLRDLALSDALTTLGAPAALIATLEGSLSGTLVLSGLVEAPQVALAVSAPSLSVDHASLGSLQIRGGFGGPERTTWLEGQLLPPTGALTARVEIADAGEHLAVVASSHDFPLSALSALASGTNLEASVSGDLKFAGAPEALSGGAKLQVNALSLGGLTLGDVTVEAQATSGHAQLDATLFRGQARLNAAVDLQETLPFVATATLTQTRASALLTSIPDLDIAASGTLFAQGALLNPAAITADAQLEQLRIAWHGLALEAAHPVRAHYGQRRADIDELRLAGSQLQLSLAGGVTLAGALSLRAHAQGDLEALRRLWVERLDLARGSFDVKLAVGGDWEVPTFDGEAQIEDGMLRPRHGTSTIENIQARAVFLRRSVSVEGGTARIGAGSLRFGGQASLPDNDVPQVDLQVTLASVSTRPFADTELVASGNLNLVGPIDDLLLRGAVQLDSLRYTANVDLERLIPKQDRAPLRVPAFTPEESLRLAVRVSAPGNVLIANNVLEAELRADLLVTGTTERLGLVGSVTPLWARARYRDNVFRVERASIDFVDEYSVFSQFDVRARTRACNMDVTVDINGDSRHYNVMPQGQDENGAVDPQDVLLCLQFGLRLRDFEGPNAATLQDTLPGGLDALWTVSGLDEKVRQLLPIKVDEFRLTSGWSSTSKRTVPRVLVGKDFGRNLQLKYWRSLTETNDQELAVDYRLTEIATVQASWDSASEVPTGDFGLDLRLRWEFR